MSSADCQNCIACRDECEEGITVPPEQHDCTKEPEGSPPKSAPVKIPEPNPWSHFTPPAPRDPRSPRPPSPAKLTRQYTNFLQEPLQETAKSGWAIPPMPDPLMHTVFDKDYPKHGSELTILLWTFHQRLEHIEDKMNLRIQELEKKFKHMVDLSL